VSGRVSSEWPLHRAVYREFPEAGAVLHAHPRFATTLACLRMGLPAVHYLLALAGADVRCSAYAAPGSEELAQAAVDALRERRACLLANHGLVAFGASPGDALALALEVETVAEYYWRGLQAGTPVALSEAEVEEVRARLGSYRTPPEAAE
jgi:L-fuculose-phosphate aldolase